MGSYLSLQNNLSGSRTNYRIIILIGAFDPHGRLRSNEPPTIISRLLFFGGFSDRSERFNQAKKKASPHQRWTALPQWPWQHDPSSVEARAAAIARDSKNSLVAFGSSRACVVAPAAPRRHHNRPCSERGFAFPEGPAPPCPYFVGRGGLQ